MRIYPAVDLLHGSVVRLRRGRWDSVTVHSKHPLDVAQAFARAGASFLHVVDLDGANGEPRQTKLIADLAARSGLKVQTGGGIRTVADVRVLKEAGIDRVILGSVIVRDPSETLRILDTFGVESVVLGLDVCRAMRVAIQGWRKTSSQSIFDLVERYAMLRPWVLSTVIECDGMLSGPDGAFYRRLIAAFPDVRFIASGGVRHVEDMMVLRGIGMAGVVLGRSLYEGTVSLCEVLSYQGFFQ